MNILFCYPTEINPNIGGVERVTDILSRELNRRGYNIFFLHNYFLHGKAEYPNYDYDVKVEKFPFEDYQDKRNLKWYHNYLIKNKIDVVINQTGQFGDSLLYCNTNGICRIISVAHTSPELNLKYLFGELKQLRLQQGKTAHLKRILRCILYPKIYLEKYNNLKRHYKWVTSNSDIFVLLSDRFIPGLRKFYKYVNNNKSISNPLTYAINKSNEKENIVLWIGRMDNPKRPDLMIKIWRRINILGWKLIMIGDGVLMNYVKRLSKGINNIEFTGYTDPLPYYKKAKILCMTSGHEGFGMVLTEAMSQGCVPIAFASYESIYDILADERQLVKPMNIKEYSSKLKSLMDNQDSLLELKEVGFKEVEKFDVEKIADQWESLFSNLIK